MARNPLPGLDIETIRNQPELVRSSLVARGLDPELVTQTLEADAVYRGTLGELEVASQEKNRVSKAMSNRPDNFEELKAKAKELAVGQNALAEKRDAARATLAALTSQIPNLVHPAVPAGGEADFNVLKTHGEKKELAFTPKPHYELGAELGLFDSERGVKVSGSRFVFLKGNGAILEKALIDYSLGKAIEAGFVPLTTPTLVKPEIMEGTGFTTKHNDEIYYLPADELYLTGTSEVALAGYHAGEIITVDEPINYVGISTCYRREAGAAGKDTRGIIRLHQFNKLEGFIYATLEDAEAQHEKLLALQEEILQGLELHYRVIDTAAGDLGTSAYRKFDVEAWIPSQNRYLELTSSSNCLTYQAKQLDIRERTEEGNRAVATLNGTLATTRWLVAILEQHQDENGNVKIPETLLPYTYGITELVS